MSILTSSPTTPTPHRHSLEPLQELRLESFSSWYVLCTRISQALTFHSNNTPSSKTASLPTPGGPSVPLANSAVFEDTPLGYVDMEIHSFNSHSLLSEVPMDAQSSEWGLLDYDPRIAVPNAPLIKDLDSFTEGTGAGSFDSIPAADTDEHGNPLPPLSQACLSMVSTHCKDDYVLRWLEDISHWIPQSFLFSHDLSNYHYQPHGYHDHRYFYSDYDRVLTLKRPRSMTEYEEHRPSRPHTRSCPSSRRSNFLEPD